MKRLFHPSLEVVLGSSPSQFTFPVIKYFSSLSASKRLCPINRPVPHSIKCTRFVHSTGLLNNISNSSSNLVKMSRKSSLQELVISKLSNVISIDFCASLTDALFHLINNKSKSSFVNNEKGDIVGLYTESDILQFIYSHNALNWRDLPISDAMTPRDKLICCSEEDSLEKCSELMLQLKINNLPVLNKNKNEIIGNLQLHVLLEAFTSHTGGHILDKKRFMDLFSSRVLPSGARIRLSPQRSLPTPIMDIDVGAFLLPNPYKTNNGVSANKYHHGHNELCEDLELTEDSHFVYHTASTSYVSTASATSYSRPAHKDVYLAIADGVGSWRDLGIDPRLFSKALIENALNVLKDGIELANKATPPLDSCSESKSAALLPIDIMQASWSRTVDLDKIVGSSTLCIAAIDCIYHSLTYSNIGDGGIIILRYTSPIQLHGTKENSLNPSERFVAHASRQQLRSFNLPFQLGFCDIPKYPSKFESPRDADTNTITLARGDIIIMATDGLYDNLDLKEILDETVKWEAAGGSSATLAEALVRRARAASLDNSRDSPFALLAKENDIMWGGGMPDDTTVITVMVK